MKLSQVAEIAAQHNLLLLRMIDLESIKDSAQIAKARLSSWQSAGHAGTMSYMERDPEIFFDLDKFLPGARSILSFSIPYSNGEIEKTPSGYGRVARYAWGRDYHKVLKKRLERFTHELKLSYPQIKTRIFTDSVPLLERFLAQVGGDGFIGKNTMHIIPSIGSFTFLCEVITDLKLDVQVITKENSYGCKTCSRCLNSCPTGAFPAPFILDANRCISYLTIEYKGAFSQWQQSALGEWLFGCDICQEVCPFNHKGIRPVIDDDLVPANGNGPFLKLETILQIKDEADFLKRFAGTPLMRAGYGGLLRNCCAVVANKKEFSLLPQIINLLKHENKIITASAHGALNSMREFSDKLESQRIDRALATQGRDI